MAWDELHARSPRPLQVTRSATINAETTLTLGDLRALLDADIPDSATVTVTYQGGDQREQTSGRYVVRVSW